MTFSSIIIKNLKFNFKKYIAYFIANSFIIAVLLMYGSLIFSKEFTAASETNALKGNFLPILVLMISFSIVFISYTTISFIRYRGKEFGVYLTLGVTTRDLRKILFVENILILFASMVTGMIVGTLFSRLFYMIIGKILWIDNFRPSLNIKTYSMCIAIALIIFLINSIFQIIFVGKLSIMELIKSSFRAEVGKNNFIIGTIALIALITALYLFPKIIKQEIFKENGKPLIIVVITTIIAPYFVIGSLISMVNKVVVKFKNTYNNNLLVLSSLQHKFMSYKSVIYLVLILAAAAITFISMTYSMYGTIEKNINIMYPYDFGFIENTKLNKISDQQLKSIVRANGGEIKEHKVLESLNLMDYRSYEGEVLTYGRNIAVISQSNYNNHMGTNIIVNNGELVQVSNSNTDNKFKNSDVIINFSDLSKQEEQIAKLKDDKNVTRIEDFLATIDKNSYIYVDKSKKKYIQATYTNEFYSLDYSRGTALIINDEDYKRIKDKLGKQVVSYDHLIRLKDSKDYKSFNNILSELKKLNHGDESLKPKFKQQILEKSIRENGFILFSSLFLGMMLLVSSGVVLYFKVLTGVDEEKERVKKLVQLGMTGSEVSKVLTKELTIIFFTPVVLSVSLITYFLSVIFGIVQNGDYMFNKSLCVVASYIVLQMVAFFITRGRYIREVVG